MPLLSSSARSSDDAVNEHPVQVTTRFDAIDLLRGLSIVGVVLFHLSLCISLIGSFGHTRPQYHAYRFGAALPPWVFHALFEQGSTAVLAFFSVSGFLITFVSYQRFGGLQNMRPARFYRIRFARIAPLLLAVLVYLCVGNRAGIPSLQFGSGTLGRALVAALTFRMNVHMAHFGYPPPPWAVLWSLSVEEVFYLFFPLACVAFLRRRWARPLFGLLLCTLCIVGPLARSPWWTSNLIWQDWSYLSNFDCIAFGCATALLAQWLLRRRTRVPAAALMACQCLGAALSIWVTVLPLGAPHIYSWFVWTRTTPTLLSIGVCLIMLGSVLQGKPSSKLTLPVRWVGRLSYEIYLTHQLVLWPLIELFLRQGRGPVLVPALGACVLVVAVGYAMARLISEPANRTLRGAPLPMELAPALRIPSRAIMS